MQTGRLRDSLAPALGALRAAGARALDIVYPPVCLSCRRATAGHGGLCPDCWGQMRFIERPYCERLGTPFDMDLGQPGLLSPQAMADPPVFARARAAVRFDEGPARILIYRFKYYDRLEVARSMALWMARAGAELLGEADALAPMPLHWTRLASRRYNQAAVLAQALSRQMGLPVVARALDRVKATAPQVGLSRAQRAANLQGAFRTPEESRLAILDKAVVLVDDVLTSGASANAAARALLRGGAKRVDVLTFARVVTGA